MKVLFITKSFYPHGDATSVIVKNISEEFIKRGVEVNVAALTDHEEDVTVKMVDGIRVSNVYVPELINLYDAGYRKNISIIYKKVLARIKAKLIPSYRRLSLNPLLVNAFQRVIPQIIHSDEFDFCLITMMPHEAVLVYEREKCRPKHVVYQLDSYWNNTVYPEQYSKNRLDFEKRVIMGSCLTITTPLIYESYIKICPELCDKVTPLEFPMVRNNSRVISNKKRDARFHCVFVGNLYKDIRPPEKVVHLISLLGDNEIVFDFFGTNQHLIEQSPDYEKSKDIIRLYRHVSIEQAETARNEADVLISIDNTNLTQVPSKLFEYISTGKPIINFYFDDNSPTLRYLERYPLSLNLNVESKEDNELITRILDFVGSCAGKTVEYSQIRRLFYEFTPEYVAGRILGILRSADSQL